jgi:hypothetical protein
MRIACECKWLRVTQKGEVWYQPYSTFGIWHQSVKDTKLVVLLPKHLAMKKYGGADIQLHTFLISAQGADEPSARTPAIVLPP